MFIPIFRMSTGGESIDWTIELRLSERCADKSASNYHAWCHRQWVLQKAPQLLQFEARITEKFIRKHIGDYSGYNHRQHVLTQMLATGCHEERQKLLIDDYRSLCDYVQSVCGPLAPERPQSIDQLLELVLPPARQAEARQCAPYRLITLLYCLNSAAYDLRMCVELTDMYGFREAFNCHRRSALQFIVAQCAAGPAGSPVTAKPPVQKLARRMEQSDATGMNVNGSANKVRMKEEQRTMDVSSFVAGIRLAEAERGEMHRKWCSLFLGFDYSEWQPAAESGTMQMDGNGAAESP